MRADRFSALIGGLLRQRARTGNRAEAVKLPAPEVLLTSRLLLRRWRDADRVPFAALNADPEVMEHFPAPRSRAQSDELIDRIEHEFDQRGYGLWAVEVRATGALAGFAGLAVAPFAAHFTPAVEIGWRLARPAWGKGYATEAAVASLGFGFNELGLNEIVACTTPANLRSRAVMERIGMTRDPAEDFDHPDLPPGHQLRRHVLYRRSRENWKRSQALRA